jgi:H+-transporting ATPase
MRTAEVAGAKLESSRRLVSKTDEEIMGKKESAYLDQDDADPEDENESFEFNHTGLTTAEAEALLAIHGRNELPEKITPKWLIFCRTLWEPMPLMIWAAAICEAAMENWIDMGILLGIQFINASIGYYENIKAADAVQALKASLKPTATVKRDGTWKTINAALVVPTDLVLLALGGTIPADCRLNNGQIEVDQAALTGESLPVTMYKGDSCKMSSTVSRGECEGTVEFTGSNTFFGKTASLLVSTGETSNLAKVINAIMFTLVALSVIMCTIVFVYLYQSVDGIESLSFTVVLLVASIPLANEIVCTTTLALGSKEISNLGAIVTRLTAIEDLANLSLLCCDKTGNDVYI